MPVRHSSPEMAEPQETEQLKKPRKRGPGTRRPKSPQTQHPVEASGSPSAPPSPSETQAPYHTSTLPEPLNTPELPFPSASTSGAPSTDTAPPHANVSAEPVSTASSQNGNNTNRPPKPGAESSPPGGVITVNGIDFHHASEAEFARLLTYYGIEWQYEPHQFPLQWRDGRPIEMFSPDFYLTEYDLYIELTTMRQSLVRRKNRKLRLLRALYPDINIKLLYRRDYQRLLDRFGIRPEEIEAEMPYARSVERSE